MSARPIVRDPDVLGGRWHFAGTTITVADVRLLLSAADPAHAQDTLAIYAAAGLTAEDLAAAQAFDFPDLHEVSIELTVPRVTVNCVCGEHTTVTAAGPALSLVPCPCGRTWRIDVAAKLL
jgi:uncharacterized protein (DUF433 family)